MISILHRIVNIFEVCLVEMENQVLKETEPEIPQEELVSDKPGPKEDVISTHINFEDEEDKEDELDANEIELAKEYRQLNEYEDSGEDDDDCEDTEEAEESKEQPTATNELPESVKSDSAIDSRLVPVKKGDFFEHDNRDNENTDKAEETIATAAQNLKIKPISNKESAKAAPNAAAAAAAGEKGRDTQEKWTHDLFDKQQEEKKEQLRKNRQRAPKEPRPQTTKSTDKQVQSKSVRNHHNNDNQRINTKKLNKPVEERPKGEHEHTGDSKGLSLSEYLEQNESNKNVDASNRRGKKPQGNKEKTTGNKLEETEKSESKKTDAKPDLMKRLDFSTQQPISSENFLDRSNYNRRPGFNKFQQNETSDLSNQMYSLQITTNSDLSKRIVTTNPVDKSYLNEQVGQPIQFRQPNKPYQQQRVSNEFNNNNNNNKQNPVNKVNFDEYNYQDDDLVDNNINNNNTNDYYLKNQQYRQPHRTTKGKLKAFLINFVVKIRIW